MQETNSLIHNPEDKSWEDKVFDPESEAVNSVGEDQGVEMKTFVMDLMISVLKVRVLILKSMLVLKMRIFLNKILWRKDKSILWIIDLILYRLFDI